MDLIKVSQLDPSTEITENDLIMVVREINGTKYSFKTNVKSLLDKVNYDLATDVTGKPALVGAQNTDYMPIIRKVGQSVTAYKITTEELVKLSKFDFPKTVNDSSSLSTLEDTDLIAIVRNETNGGTVRKINYKDFKDLVGKVKTVQGIEPDKNGNIALSVSGSWIKENDSAVIQLRPKAMLERWEIIYDSNLPSMGLSLNFSDINGTTYTSEFINNYVGTIILRNDKASKTPIKLSSRFAPGGYIFYQGQKINNDTPITLSGTSVVLEIRFGQDRTPHVTILSGGGVETVSGILPDTNNDVQVLSRVKYFNNYPVINWNGIGNFTNISRSASISLASGRPANWDVLGWKFEIAVDTRFVQNNTVQITIDPTDIVWPDGTPFSTGTAENILEYNPGELNKLTFTYIGNGGKFMLEDSRNSNGGIKNGITGNSDTGNYINLYINSNIRDGWGAAVYQPAAASFITAFLRLNRNSFMQSRIPWGWSFTFSLTMSTKSSLAANSIPVTLDLGDSFAKLYDGQLNLIDKSTYLVAERGVVKWFKLRYVRSVGFVIEPVFKSNAVSVDGALPDTNNNISLHSDIVTYTNQGTQPSQTHTPVFKGLFEQMSVEGNLSLTTTIDLSNGRAAVGWKTYIRVKGSTDGVVCKAKFKGNSTVKFINTQGTETSIGNVELTGKPPFSYYILECIGENTYSVHSDNPGNLYSSTVYTKPACVALTEYCNVKRTSDNDYSKKVMDLSNIRTAKGGFRLIVDVSTTLYISGYTFVDPTYGFFNEAGDGFITVDPLFPLKLEFLKYDQNNVIINDLSRMAPPAKLNYVHDGEVATINPYLKSFKSIHSIRVAKGTLIVDLSNPIVNGVDKNNWMVRIPDDWEMILDLEGFTLSPTPRMQFKLDSNTSFYYEGTYFKNAGSSVATVLERFIGPGRQQYRITVRQAVMYIDRVNSLNIANKYQITTGDKKTIMPKWHVRREDVYISSDNGELVIDTSEYDANVVGVDYEMNIIFQSNTGAKITFKGFVSYEGTVKEGVTVSAGLFAYKLVACQGGSPILYKLS